MKVAVTFDFDDDELVAIGLMHSGKMKPAKRVECREYVTFIIDKLVSNAAEAVGEYNQKAASEVRSKLGVVSPPSAAAPSTSE